MAKTYILTARCQYFTTSRETDEKVVDRYSCRGSWKQTFRGFFAREVSGGQKFIASISLYLLCLITGNEREKKCLKPLSVVKEVCQAFCLFVNKVVKFTEAFKYAVTSVSLVVAIINATLYHYITI